LDSPRDITSERRMKRMKNISLSDYRKLVHDQGFNISMMINKFKKSQRERKATYTVPDEVFISVCKEYLRLGKGVDHSWPYFMKVLVLKAHEHNANHQIQTANSQRFSRSMPTHLKDLLNPNC
jgi:hypothetical protein